ncbi:LysR substrate-binding domain-containing protein [Planotetraspora kaengkrachanensis]|uniref:LysR family transcriptional regulator n=2 Tax=Planotetraspora kaengkrachanensis TaxID=575193 RepID=A0A8J3PVB8_9ACTN|nr:LysR family transcriptional regulator [Planotetraspora kaengkrachanensis]
MLFMDLIRHLSQFLVLAEELHFGNAAARLGLAQPPLSQRIKRLEDELGVKLFERSSRRVTLTAAGRLLVPEAQDLVARAERLRHLVAGSDGEDGTAVRVGVPPDLGGTMLAALIAAYRARLPEVRLSPAEMGTAAQVAALVEGELDVGLVRHPVAAAGLGFGAILTQHPGVLLAESDELAAWATVHLADLAGRALVLSPREAEPGLYDETLACCRRSGFVPADVIAAGTAEFALGLVLSGTAVSFGPPAAPPGTVWRPLAGAPLAWRLSTAWRGKPAPHVEEFAAVALRVLREDAGLVDEGSVPALRVAPRPATGFLA